jgi:hypothetical protein
MAFKEEGSYNNTMAITTVYTGDTIRIKGTFKNSSNVLIDADANAVTFTVYSYETKKILSTGNASRLSTGIFYYDYEVPSTETKYIVELKGDFDGYPQLARSVIKAKFRI